MMGNVLREPGASDDPGRWRQDCSGLGGGRQRQLAGRFIAFVACNANSKVANHRSPRGESKFRFEAIFLMEVAWNEGVLSDICAQKIGTIKCGANWRGVGGLYHAGQRHLAVPPAAGPRHAKRASREEMQRMRERLNQGTDLMRTGAEHARHNGAWTGCAAHPSGVSRRPQRASEPGVQSRVLRLFVEHEVAKTEAFRDTATLAFRRMIGICRCCCSSA
jgi:hypothetical protein